LHDPILFCPCSDSYGREEVLEAHKVEAKDLVVGKIVVVLYKDPSQGYKKEWHRGKIMDSLENDTFLVSDNKNI